MEEKTKIFEPLEYLNQYYLTPLGHSEEKQMPYFSIWIQEALDLIPECQICLEIGSGPCLVVSGNITKKAKKVILSEFNEVCFQPIVSWIKKQNNAFNWSAHFEDIAKRQNSDGLKIAERLRNSILACVKCDLTKEKIFQFSFLNQVDLIVSSLCIEAVAETPEQFKQIIRKIKGYLKMNGHLFLQGVLEESFYKVGNSKLHCFKVTKQLLKETLDQEGFMILKLQTIQSERPPSETSDFQGVFCVLAKLTH